MNSNRLSLILSTLALVIALTVGGAYAKNALISGKQIKNNSITTKDLKTNGVRTSDLDAGAVRSADIDQGAVTPDDVTMPVPGTSSPAALTGPVTDAFTKLGDVGTYTKVQAESILSVTWSGAAAPGPGTNCVFQIRVNGSEPIGGGGEVFAQTGAVNVSSTALFGGLPAGSVNVEVWARLSGSITATPTCEIGPANPGIKTTFTFNEEVI